MRGGHKNLNNFESYRKVLAEILNFRKSKGTLEGCSFKVIHN